MWIRCCSQFQRRCYRFSGQQRTLDDDGDYEGDDNYDADADYAYNQDYE